MFYSMCLELCCCLCFSVAKLCLTLGDSMDHSLPGSFVHGISQARIPEWGSISFSSWIFPTQGLIPCLLNWQADSLPLSHQGSSMPRISSTKSFLYNALLHITNNLSSYQSKNLLCFFKVKAPKRTILELERFSETVSQ